MGDELTAAEALSILREHNEWRRGGESNQLAPEAIGRAIDVAIAHLSRTTAAQPSVWMPIESAPKDIAFLGFRLGRALQPVICVWLDAEHPDANGEAGFVEHWGLEPVDLTHWMPLPPPPCEVK